MTPKSIKALLEENLQTIKKYCYSITYVGSCALKTNEQNQIKSDFDIILILYDISAVAIIEDFFKRIFKDKVSIIQGWGLVSFEKIGSPVIHLLIDTVDTLMQRNTLFLNSVSKYKAVYGKNLSDLIKFVEITPDVLLNDGDGIHRHYSDLNNKRFDIGQWVIVEGKYQCKPVCNEHSSLLDQVIYISLQAMRNYLRLLGHQIEFNPNVKNQHIWTNEGLRFGEFLLKIINIKDARKLIGDKELQLDGIYNESLEFMAYLIKILTNNSSQHAVIKHCADSAILEENNI